MSFRQAFGLIRPETALVWFKKHIQGLWRYPHKTAGRKPLLQSTKKAHPPAQAREPDDALRERSPVNQKNWNFPFALH
jgi:hypothetical protein